MPEILKCCDKQTMEMHCSEMGGELIGLIEEEEEHFATGIGVKSYVSTHK